MCLAGAFSASAADLAVYKSQPRISEANLAPWAYAWLGYGHTHAFDGGYVGIMAALNGNIASDGWILRVDAQKGRYDAASVFNSGGDVDTDGADIMVGYRKRYGASWFDWYVGPSYESHHNPDETAVVRGTKAGVKVGADFYAPLNSQVTFFTYAYYASPFNTYQAYGRLGFNIWSPAWAVGPEISTFGNDAYREVRYGAFSRWQTWFGEFVLSGGAVSPLTDAQSGYYVQASLGFELQRPWMRLR
jgi:hypothetical protein